MTYLCHFPGTPFLSLNKKGADSQFRNFLLGFRVPRKLGRISLDHVELSTEGVGLQISKIEYKRPKVFKKYITQRGSCGHLRPRSDW